MIDLSHNGRLRFWVQTTTSRGSCLRHETSNAVRHSPVDLVMELVKEAKPKGTIQHVTLGIVDDTTGSFTNTYIDSQEWQAISGQALFSSICWLVFHLLMLTISILFFPSLFTIPICSVNACVCLMACRQHWNGKHYERFYCNMHILGSIHTLLNPPPFGQPQELEDTEQHKINWKEEGF